MSWIKKLFGSGGSEDGAGDRPEPVTAPGTKRGPGVPPTSPGAKGPTTGPGGKKGSEPPTGPRQPTDRRAVVVGQAPWQSDAVALSPDPRQCRSELRSLLLTEKGKEETPEHKELVGRLLKATEAADLDLPPFPQVCVEMNRLLATGEPSVMDVVRLVDQDPALVRAVWKRGSSVVFGPPPDSLKTAITRVGFNELWRIAMTVCLQQGVFKVRGFQEQAESVRLHGIIAADVAAWFGGESRGPLYLAGLLHDGGKLVVYHAAGTSPPQNRPKQDFVQSIAKRYHPSFGLLLAHAWGLGDDVAAAAGFHHAPEKAPPANRRAAELTRIADIASHVVVDPDPEMQRLGKVALVGLRLETHGPSDIVARAYKAFQKAAGDAEARRTESVLDLQAEPLRTTPEPIEAIRPAAPPERLPATEPYPLPAIGAAAPEPRPAPVHAADDDLHFEVEGE